MYAIVRLNTFDEQKLAAAADDVAAFDRLHSSQPGYVGNLVVDLDPGRRLVVNLWDSEQDAVSALSILGPEVDRILTPLMNAPPQLIGTGPVSSTDLIRAR
ncbi:MAG: hypothetical protein QOD46_800 [Actinomycetota bacterium]|jgi:hypothetical protein|nr:hypothetical protein [Actinomycetota bacterium]